MARPRPASRPPRPTAAASEADATALAPVLELGGRALRDSLAGYREAPGFGTDLGRACVMLTRHRAHLTVVCDTATPRSLAADPDPSPAVLTHRALLDTLSATTAGGPQPKRKSRANRGGSAAARGASGDSLTSPMQGTIVKIAVANGDTVAEGDLIVVLEAMKMEQPLTAHKSGVIKDLSTSTGDTVSAGTVLANITD